MRNFIKRIIQFLLIFFHQEDKQQETVKNHQEKSNKNENTIEDKMKKQLQKGDNYYPGTVSFARTLPVHMFGEHMLYARTHKKYLRLHHLGKYKKGCKN